VAIAATAESAVTNFLIVNFPGFFMMALSYTDIQAKKNVSKPSVNNNTTIYSTPLSGAQL
jgi:hypothetical protein